MRLPMIAGNWKMNTTVAEALSLVGAMLPGLDKVPGVEKVICPPFISLAAVKEMLQGSSVKLGAQNVYHEPRGAFTGEISPPMLAELCRYVIVGHSERRQYFGESGEFIDKKLKALLEAGLTPVLCIGESLEQNEAGKTEEVLAAQLAASPDEACYRAGMVIAYEPVWAIGTGRSATGQQANETIGFIRGELAKRHGGAIAGDVRILYGGSVTAANTAEIMRQPEIDGALVGGASLKADDFISIARQASEIRGLS